MTLALISELFLPKFTRAQGRLSLPGSKSISNRVLLLAALAEGKTRLHGLLDSDDTRVMLSALRACGIQITTLEDGVAEVYGVYPFPYKSGDFFLGNAGTAVRPLTAALAVMGGDYLLRGVPRMHERPIKDLVDALRSMGASIDYLETEGYPPLRIGQANIDSTRVVSIKANVSSQFLTALLMAAPLCAVHNDVVIQVEGELISRPYIQITLNLMARFGVQVQEGDNNRFIIPQGAAYQSPGDFHIEGDASSASYFMALGLLGGGPIHIDGVGANSIQGDMAFADVITALGGQVEQEEQSVCVSSPGVAGGWRLKAFDQDFNLLPDAAMTAAVLALFADGPCLLRNIGSWRVKETDRIAAMHTELEKLGAQVESGPDWLQVYPLSLDNWQEAQIATYDDHRMAMCFSLAAFGRAVDILDPHCVAKTFPDYFRVFQNLVYV